jgi:predicted dehydrogenase
LVVAVQRREREIAEKVARDFNIEHAVTSVEEMVRIPGLQAVIEASTPNVHYQNVKTCLDHGLHVLVEKPMTFTAAQAGELVELAREKGLQLVIGCPWHYTAHGREARRLIAEGSLGKLNMVSMLFTNFSGGLYRARPLTDLIAERAGVGEGRFVAPQPYIVPGINSYSDPAVAGGGQIFSQVSHAAAYLGFLTGSPPSEVFARFDNAGLQIDVHDALCVKLDNGCLVTLASTGDTMPSKRHFEVRAYGSEGMLLLELWTGTMEFHPRRGKVVVYPVLDNADAYPLYAPASNLVDTALGVAENKSPGELGHYAMKIIEAACTSARTGRNIRLDDVLPTAT